MKAAVAVLAVAVLALAVWARSLEQSVSELKATRAPSLELQAKCAEQARKVFADLGYKVPTAGFENHYNAEMNRCFVQIDTQTSTNGGARTSNTTVIDAFEGTVLGNCDIYTDTNRFQPSPQVVDCTVTLPSGEMKTCHSGDEFTELVKVYMGRKPVGRSK